MTNFVILCGVLPWGAVVGGHVPPGIGVALWCPIEIREKRRKSCCCFPTNLEDNCHPCRQSHLQHNEETSGKEEEGKEENLAHFPCEDGSKAISSYSTPPSRPFLTPWVPTRGQTTKNKNKNENKGPNIRMKIHNAALHFPHCFLSAAGLLTTCSIS